MDGAYTAKVPGGRRRRVRDLSQAITLRPIEIYQLYGIPPSTLCDMCKHNQAARRLPSTLLPGRNGGKGLRLVNHDDLRAYLERFKEGAAA
jgi:hypothetical protein